MKTKDGRTLTAQAQQELRYRVVHAIVDQKMTQVQACRLFGVSRTAVYYWLKTYRNGGATALKARRRGPKRSSRLADFQAATIVRMITDRCSDQYKLPFMLWTRQAVRDLIEKQFGISVSVWTVGRYLKHWEFTPQKPLRRADEQDPQAAQRKLHEDYLAIGQQARQEKAEIHGGDQMGLRSDHQAGRSYGRKGQTSVVAGTGRRFGCQMISTVTNRVRLSFMLFQQRFTSAVMLQFLKRLVKQQSHKVFLIVDGHPVHRSGAVRRWVEGHAEQIRLFYLPVCRPRLNPDELVNQDVKTNAVGRQRPAHLRQMLQQVRSYLWSRQKRPDLVKRYFQHKDVQYAAF